jgi:adenosylhomocysteine nucleosidase
MRPRVAIIAALPREISVLVNGWPRNQASSAKNVRVYSSDDAIVVCAGMGANRAMVAAGEALSRGPVSQLISAGYAGALHDGLKVGDVVRPGVVVDARTGERFFAESGKGTLVTGASVAGVSEKLRLRSSYGAEIVDMEAAAVARVAAQQGVPFLAIKAVSDEYDFEMQELGEFATASGQFREFAFAMFLMAHPRLWKKAARLAGGGRVALKALTAELRNEIARQNR